jgi:hypothetical protein
LNEEGFKKIKGFFENINSYLENKIINVANLKLPIMKLSEIKNN